MFYHRVELIKFEEWMTGNTILWLSGYAGYIAYLSYWSVDNSVYYILSIIMTYRLTLPIDIYLSCNYIEWSKKYNTAENRLNPQEKAN